MSNIILQMKKIEKSFPGVKALDNINFDLKTGEVHALVGENGAGKSTLIKILGGVHTSDSGTIEIDNKHVVIKTPIDSIKQGISIIYQEFNLVPKLTVAQNIFLGSEPKQRSFGVVDNRTMNNKTRQLLELLGKANIKPNMLVCNLTVAQQQIIEIAKALKNNSKIIVMDEPTAVLSIEETERLFAIIRDLVIKHISIIYISHRLDEIFEICNRVTVLRDGKYIDTIELPKKQEQELSVSKNQLIKLMVGRELEQMFCCRTIGYCKEEILAVEGFTKDGQFSNVNFSLNKGEILGFAGLVGAGRTELMKTIFGLEKKDCGVLKIYGKTVRIRSPLDAIKYGIGFVPEDRKKEGLILKLSMSENISITTLKSISSFGFVNERKRLKLSEIYIKTMDIKPKLHNRKVQFLSGGNQQKVVLSKWLAKEPSILILDEPTRGIDVGAKQEIYSLINKLADEGLSIIIISSEMEEILGISDRIIVMHEGFITAELTKNEATQEKILMAASN